MSITLVLQIKMVCGQSYLVDASDINITTNKWYMKNGYAYSKRLGYLHKYIMGDCPAIGLTVDHINRNRLDNRRCNLRWATISLQNYNKKTKDNILGYRGIELQSGKYRVTIGKNGTRIRQTCNTLEEAIETRKQLEMEHYGEYSC